MVIVRHSPESCPGRPGNEAVHACLHSMDELIAQRAVGVVGRWADPAAHVNYLVLDAPNAHVLQELLMESGIFGYTTAEIHPILSMD
jgi:muconolactone delta-isomerase